MEYIQELEQLSVKELYKLIEDHKPTMNPTMDFMNSLVFFNSIQDHYQPAIYNTSLNMNNMIYHKMFDYMKTLIMDNTEFKAFSIFDGCINFNKKVQSILYIKDKSYLMINPKLAHSTKNRRCNDEFTINNLTPDNKDSTIIKEFLTTSKNNILTFFNTLNEDQVRFSAKNLSEYVNNRSNHSQRLEGSEFITLRYFACEGYLQRKQLESFFVNITNNRVVTGVGPGIYGSLSYTLIDRSCITLYPNGTCLFANSKKVNISDQPMINFVYRVLFNLTFFVQLMITYMNTEQCQKQLYKPRCCQHKNPYNCYCLRFMKAWFKNHNMCTSSIEFTIEYYSTLQRIETDYVFLAKQLDTLESSHNDKSIVDKVLLSLQEYISLKDSLLFDSFKSIIFGLKQSQNINAVTFLQMPKSHNKYVCLFSGHKVNYRSLIDIQQASYIMACYRKIIRGIKQFKELLNRNIFTYTEDELDYIIDQVTNVDVDKFI